MKDLKYWINVIKSGHDLKLSDENLDDMIKYTDEFRTMLRMQRMIRTMDQMKKKEGHYYQKWRKNMLEKLSS